MQTRILAAAVLAWHAALAYAQPGTTAGIDRSTFDTAVRPQDDLYQHVNGKWLRDTVIPADKPEYGLFIELRDRADARVRKLVEDVAATQAAPGSNEFKVGAYYRAFLDEAAIDRAGTAPLAEWRRRIDGIRTAADLARVMGSLNGICSTAMDVDADVDLKEPGIYRAETWQDGLGLPTRSYYFDAGERFDKARAAYLVYLQTLLALDGDKNAARNAKVVYTFEKRLAKAHWTPVENRDPVKVYNPMTLAEMSKRAPGFDWPAYFEASNVRHIDRVMVGQPSYMVAMAKAVREVPLATWRLFLRAKLLDASAQQLPQPFRDASFAFHGKAIQGNEQPRPRWQLATASLDRGLGEVVGQLYVARHFSPSHKERMVALVRNLLAAYDQSIDSLTWMSPATKVKAKEKLAKYGIKIGYPDKWRDYAGLEVREGDAFGNRVRAARFAHDRLATRAGQPVDRTAWVMTPQTVNAYYMPPANEIVFPAAILEPPYFDMASDDAANYGAIGAIIGHEISHGFDDTGSQFDGDGKLSNWWTDADRKAFDALGAQLVAQYGAYEPIPGHKLDGKLTLGENIADLSGLEIAFKAYRIALAGKELPVIDGATGDQRFFLAFAQAWREKARDERALELLTSDRHSPPGFRANGVTVNLDPFHQAFGTKPGDGMYKAPDKRIRIW